MKIVHIAPPWLAIPPQNYGGTEAVLYNLIEEQVAQGHDVTLCAPADAQTSAKVVPLLSHSLIGAGIPWQAHLKAYYYLQKSVKYIQKYTFDIVHTHLSSASDMYLFPLMADIEIPHIMTLHSRFPFDRAGPWTGEADKLYMEWALTVPMVAISEQARAEVPYALNFIGVVHHGLPLEKFTLLDAQPEGYFAWLGRMMPEKGAHLAIEAAHLADVPLVLAGNVDPHMPESVDYFERLIKPQLDGERVRYIGPVNMPQKVALLSHARGFLNPITWEEPFGMVMIEAMASGCPVIAFARGAAPEIVVHGQSGFLVHDVDQMVRYIQRIDELDRKIVRAHAERKFSVQAMTEKYTALYKKVIAAKYRVVTRNMSIPLQTAGSPFSLPAIEAAETRYPTAPAATSGVEAEPLTNDQWVGFDPDTYTRSG
ncbi:MAG TPA: glycosyltransferase family 4 protein [Ktedonobacteraceae bacterium]|jgi:glycosyltransferase involved in cell wall biosynthesis|nr:glycosyltransferase family 4 protein [Ktedonobacteraceae bacterium]